MVQPITLEVEARQQNGTAGARMVRGRGFVPAVIYGGSKEPAHVALDERDVVRQLTTTNFFSQLYELKVGNDTTKVLPRDVQFHPVSERPLHVDFMRVTDKTRLHVHVAVHVTGEENCKGLQHGGIVNLVRHTVDIICLAGNIPQDIKVDLSGLEIGDSVHINDIKLPEGAKPAIQDRDFTILTIVAPKVQEEEAAAPEGEAEAGEAKAEGDAAE